MAVPIVHVDSGIRPPADKNHVLVMGGISEVEGGADVEMKDSGVAQSSVDTPLARDAQCTPCGPTYMEDNTAAPIVILRDPGAPSAQEIEEHDPTHLPYRSWCPVCVAACGKEDGHFQSKEKDRGGKPIVSLDYKSFGQEGKLDDKATSIVVRDNESQTTFAHICLNKGPTDIWTKKKILEDLDLLGHVDVILKTDGEPALVSLMEEVKKSRVQPTFLRHPPAYDPQANGAAEHAVQDYMGQFRKLKIALERRIGQKVESSWAVIELMSEYAALLLSRYPVRKDGRTPHKRLMESIARSQQ